MKDEILLTFGGEVKALENGHFGGYLVRFSSADDPDLEGEFFTKNTDFGIQDDQKTPVYFNHRQPLAKKTGGRFSIKQKIGEATMSVDEVGVLVDAIIWNRDNYEKAVIQAGKKKKLGWSSGTSPHIVETESAGKATWIKTWTLGIDASLTPIPAEPYNSAITLKAYSEAVKSLKFAEFDEVEGNEDEDKPATFDQPKLAAKLNQHIDDAADDKGRTKEAIVAQMGKEAGLETKVLQAILDGKETPSNANLKAFARVLKISFESLKTYQRQDHLQTIKGMFEDAMAEEIPSRWELESVYCKIIRKLANAASASQMAGVKFDLEAKLQEATNEYTALLKTHALTQIQSWLEEGADDDFYLKSILDSESTIKALDEIDVDEHSQVTVSVLQGFHNRLQGNHVARTKAGRVLSEKNRRLLLQGMTQAEAVIVSMKELLDKAQPKASDAAKRAALTKHLMFKQRQRAEVGA